MRRGFNAAGVGILLGSVFVAGLIAAFVLFNAFDFHAKTEIDLVEVLKVGVIAGAAVVVKKYFDRQEHISKTEEQTVSALVTDALATARSCQEKYRQCVPLSKIDESSRDALVGLLAQLENEIVAIEELLRRSNVEPPDELASALDEFAEVLTNSGLADPRLCRPAAEAGFRRIRVALHSVPLAVSRR